MSKHTDPTPIRFFKIIPGTSLQEGKLRIPKKFIRKYGGDMSNPMFLKPPDGTKWEVFWTENDGDIWLQRGWIEFATYYSLDHGHLLLFEYKQTCNFEIHIFDMSTLEIDYPLHVSQDAQDNLDTTSDDESIKILDEVPPSHKTRQKSPMPSPQPRKKSRTGTSGGVEKRSTEQNVPHHVQTEGTNFEKSKFAYVKKELDGYPFRGTQYEQQPCQNTRLKSPVACRQSRNKLKTSTRGEKSQGTNFGKSKIAAAKKELDEDVDGTFRSNNPSFMVLMKPTYVDNHYLRVPTEFAKKHLKEKQRNILLHVLDGRTWPAKYSFRRINAGWNKFVSDNNLKVGDVCHFELSKNQGISLKVLIFPLAEEPHTPPVQGTKRSQRASLLIRPSLNTNGALKEAYKFASENPFFTFKVGPEIQCRPLLSVAFVREYFDNKTQIVKLRCGKKVWPIKFLCYPHNSAAMFSGGWFQFARDCKLVVGDVCVFELINREDAVFDVHIFRRHT